MNFQLSIRLLASQFCLVHFCYAGVRDVGNGGEAVVCRSEGGKIFSIEILDTYEGRVLGGHKLDLGPANLPFEQKVEKGLERVLRRDPTRGKRFLSWFATFFKGVEWVNQPLPATPDVDPSLFPKKCKIEQIAIQKNNWANRDWYEYGVAVRINRPLWDALDNDQKATLIIHEIVYHEALPSFLPSAKPVRDYTSLVTTTEFLKLSDLHYVELVAPLRYLGDLDIYGLNVMIPTVMFRGDNTFESDSEVSPNWPAENFYPSGRLRNSQLTRDQNFVTIHNRVLPLNARTLVIFYDQPRYLFRGHLRKRTAFKIAHGDVFIQGQFALDKNQNLATGYISHPQALPVSSELKIRCSPERLSLTSNQEVRSCFVSRDGYIIETSMLRITVVDPGFIYFKDGQIDFESPDSFRTPVFGGAIKIHGDAFESDVIVSELRFTTHNGPGPARVKLASPSSINLRGSLIRLEGRIKIYNGNRLASIEPIHDFEYLSEGTKVPIAAKYKCGVFSEERKASPVEFDRDGNLSEFTASGSVQYRGYQLKLGTHCLTDQGGFRCYDLCD